MVLATFTVSTLGARLIHLGDLGFTVPVAAALGAALLAAGARRLALCWSVAFCTAMLAVGANKIGFMSWGIGLPSLDFKAASGHAAGATAIFPMLLYLAGRRGRRLHVQAGLAGGLALGLLVALSLVLCEEHSLAEALAGCALGAAASLWSIAQAGPGVLTRPAASALCFGLAFALAAWLMHFLPVAGWMFKAARLLAGPRGLHSLAPG